MFEKFKDIMSKKNKNTTPDNGDTVAENEIFEEISNDATENQEGNTEDAVKLSPLEQLEAEKLEIEQQAAELKNKYLRLYAEFENFKKRTVREKFDFIKNASRDTLSALLPVLDDFDRAKKVADAEDSTEQFSEGVTLVYNKLKNILKQKGLTEMVTTGEAFDSDLHEAITEIPAPNEDMKGKIMDTIETGYMLNDKIIRHAKVVVGK